MNINKVLAEFKRFILVDGAEVTSDVGGRIIVVNDFGEVDKFICGLETLRRFVTSIDGLLLLITVGRCIKLG